MEASAGACGMPVRSSEFVQVTSAGIVESSRSTESLERYRRSSKFVGHLIRRVGDGTKRNGFRIAFASEAVAESKERGMGLLRRPRSSPSCGRCLSARPWLACGQAFLDNGEQAPGGRRWRDGEVDLVEDRRAN
jgi:hypothetical protein